MGKPIQWDTELQEASKEFMDEIIAQVPEAAQGLFVMVLNQIAAPTKDVEQRLAKLGALEAHGVDNWTYYYDAMADLAEDEGEDEEDDDA
jgi:hypothetical protein